MVRMLQFGTKAAKGMCVLTIFCLIGRVHFTNQLTHPHTSKEKQTVCRFLSDHCTPQEDATRLFACALHTCA